LAYTWLDSENHSTGFKLERRPEHSVNWRTAYTATDWAVDVTMSYQSETYQGAFAAVADLGGFTLWQLGGSYQLTPALKVRATLDNLFDKQYQSSAGYATAGMNWRLSISYVP
jgi:vitamin B12 transporter